MKPDTICFKAPGLGRNPKVTLRLENLPQKKDEDRRMQAIKREEFIYARGWMD
ncbi:MAG: hypothetical protein AAED33_10490 [Paracoccaceae bacterium]|jgi:hypothetical protein